jgi:uroporphyrinogen decarboxylase
VTAALNDSDFLRACRQQPVQRTPVWFMRQAGRSLPEYRKVREGVAMLDACRRPELVAEITLQPVRRYGVDAAILFSDIVLPLQAIGVDLDIVPGIGPVVADPIRRRDQVAAIRGLEADELPEVPEAVRLLVAELGDTPLIGFAGAPFTLASYLIEGGPSRTHTQTKAVMFGEPDLWDALMSGLAQLSLSSLRQQVAAGASAIQLFDSWVGALSARDYAERVQPYSRRILEGLSDLAVPRIHFGVNTGELLPLMGTAGADVVGVDYRIPLAEATRRLGGQYAVQGNLDPALVFAPWPIIEAAVLEVLASGRAAPGHVFNLGHGVLPESDPVVLARIVDLVHASSADAGSAGSSSDSVVPA